MGVLYGGVSTFTLQKGEPRGSGGDIPVLVERWRGRADQRDAFVKKFPVGLAYGGGYVTNTDARDDGPWGEVDLTISLPPDFATDWPSNAISMKTASMSAKVDASGILDGETSVIAERSVSFYAPETAHRYFAPRRPDGPRYSAVMVATRPQIIRSVIKATGASKGQTINFPGLYAPAALVSALFMPIVDTVTSHQSECVPSTPWFRCTDTVTRGFQGDAQS